MKIDISRLLTINNYAKKHDVTASYIYKLIKENKMQSLFIDNVQFIDVVQYPSIPVPNRRK